MKINGAETDHKHKYKWDRIVLINFNWFLMGFLLLDL